MKLPAINQIRRKTEGVNRFTGLDQRPKTAQTAFAEMKNMTCEYLPVMASRRPRMRLRTLKHPNGLFAHDELCWVDGTDFYWDGQKVGKVEDSPKEFVRMGAYVLIWPDKAYFNTEKKEFGYLERTNRTYKPVSAMLCTLNGIAYEYEAAEEAPKEPKSGQHWLDTSRTPNVLKMWNETESMWTAIPTVYTKLSSEGIGKGFSENDGVKISGFYEYTEMNGSYYLVATSDNSLLITAMIPKSFTQTQSMTVTREMPDMDFVCEVGNRVWGCSNKKHEIYASALGDPKNWNRFMGLASDSYAVTVGTPGQFTGAASHLGNALFFKENAVHTIMGTEPSNFTLSVNTCRGVAKGSEQSLCHVNEYLMYRAPVDVCMMGTSTLPSTVSDALGKQLYRNAAAGALNSRYFMNAETAEGKRSLLVFDTKTGAWCKEDDISITHFAGHENELYFLTESGEIWSVNGTAPEKWCDKTAGSEKPFEWEMISGQLGLDDPYSKYISGIQLHLECELGSAVNVAVQYDAEERWIRLFHLDPVKMRSLTVPIIPRRCRTMRLKIYGTGSVKLFSITQKTEQGSDVYAVK